MGFFSKITGQDRAVALAKEEGKRELLVQIASDPRELARVISESPMGALPNLGSRSLGARPISIRNNPWKYSNAVNTNPSVRPDQLVPTDIIRRLADSYDVARMCIRYLKREVRRVPGKVQPKDPNERKNTSDAFKKRIAEIEAFWFDEGGIGGPGCTYAKFENNIFEAILVDGVFAAYLNKGLGGKMLSVLDIDSTTIRPLVDAYGWDVNGPTFQQWIMGIPGETYTWEELLWYGLESRTWTPTHLAPLEFLISAVTSALKADEWNRSWLTDGNTPSDWIALPEDWTPDQIAVYADFFDEMLAGDLGSRRKMKFFPSGSSVGRSSRKEYDFEKFEMWLAKRTCGIFGVHPAQLGILDQLPRGDEQDALQAVSRLGVAPLLEVRANIYDRVLREMGHDDLQWVNAQDDTESAAARGQRLMVAVGGPWMSPNEARSAEGLPPMSGQDEIRQSPQDANASGNQSKTGATNGTTVKPRGVDKTARLALYRWQTKAIRRVKEGKDALCDFSDPSLDDGLLSQIKQGLEQAKSEEDVAEAFAI